MLDGCRWSVMALLLAATFSSLWSCRSGAASKASTVDFPEVRGRPQGEVRSGGAEGRASLARDEPVGAARGSPRGADPAAATPPIRAAETGRLPTLGDLMGHFDRRDSHALESATMQLLLAGEPGWKVLHGFFHQCDIEREKIIALTHDRTFVYPYLRIAARHPDLTAKFSIYLLGATRETTASFIRRELYNFVPVFLSYHEGRYPELKNAIQDDIIYQLEHGGDWIYKISLAIPNLGFDPPAEAYLPCLLDPARARDHDLAIRLMLRHGEKGLRTLMNFFDAEDKSSQTISMAVGRVMKLEKDRKGSPYVARLLADDNPVVRRSAHINYFLYPRRNEEVPLVVKFLNSDVDIRFRHIFLGTLRSKNPGVMIAMEPRSSEVADEALRSLVVRYARSARRRLEEKTNKQD